MHSIAYVLIVLLSGFVGVSRARALNERVRQLNAAQSAMARLHSDLEYWGLELSEALAKTGGTGVAAEAMREMGEGLKLCDERALTVIEAKLKELSQARTALTKSDIQAIGELLCALPTLTFEQLAPAFELLKGRLEDALIEARGQRDKKGRMYSSMGWIIGLCIALMFI